MVKKNVLAVTATLTLLFTLQMVVGDVPTDLNNNIYSYYQMDDASLPFTDELGNLDLDHGDYGAETPGIIDNGNDMELSLTEYAYSDAWTHDTETFSASIWLNTESEPNTWMNIIGNYHFDGSDHYGWRCSIYRYNHASNPGKVYCDFRGNANLEDVWLSTSAIDSGSGWYHIVVVYDGNIKLYINGNQDGSQILNQITDVRFSGGNNFLEVGANYYNSAFTEYFDGIMDEVSFFDGYALSSTEVTYLYNAGAPGLEQQYTFGVGGGDSTPPVISNVNCTSPDPDDTSEPYNTTDTTPTMVCITDETADCGISDVNGSYTACGTTGTTSHVCTLPSEDALNYGVDFVWLNCTDGSGNSRTEDYEMYISSCGCPGLNNNWEINMSDTCYINDNCDIGTGNLSFVSTGYVYLNSTINVSNMVYPSFGQTIWILINAILGIG